MAGEKETQSLAQIHMPPEIAREVHNFIEHLKTELQDELISIVAFGASVTGEYVHWKSSVNLLIVLKSAEPAVLALAAQVVVRWLRRFPLDPLIMTPTDLAHSKDVFPVEFVDMFHRHRLLYGESDPLDDIEIDGNALRFELEHSLRQKLARLRGHYLRVANNERALVDLMNESVERFLTLMTSLLYLQGKHPPSRLRDLCTQIQFAFSIDGEVLVTLVEVKFGKKSLSRGEAVRLFERYLSCVQNMVQRVDEMFPT